jgi:hypothetical protein
VVKATAVGQELGQFVAAQFPTVAAWTKSIGNFFAQSALHWSVAQTMSQATRPAQSGAWAQAQ